MYIYITYGKSLFILRANCSISVPLIQYFLYSHLLASQIKKNVLPLEIDK